MYLIRTAFWLSVVVMLLPSASEEPVTGTDGSAATQLSATETIGAAVSAVGDIADLCSRRPDVCDTGSAAWQVFQSKARTGIEFLYDWANSDDAASPLAEPDHFVVSDNADPVHTGSSDPGRRPPPSGAATPKSQNTLRIEDLIPQWKGPGDKTRA